MYYYAINLYVIGDFTLASPPIMTTDRRFWSRGQSSSLVIKPVSQSPVSSRLCAAADIKIVPFRPAICEDEVTG